VTKLPAQKRHSTWNLFSSKQISNISFKKCDKGNIFGNNKKESKLHSQGN